MTYTLEIVLPSHRMQFICEAQSEREAREKAQKFARELVGEINERGLMFTYSGRLQ